MGSRRNAVVVGGGGRVSDRDDERIVSESYERVPYPSGSEHHSHPSHVAAMAILHGIDSAPPEDCRVLELGCADGGNLIPMAFELRQSRFTGIDLSPRQIDSGRAFANDLGLTNIDLKAMSIRDVDASLGTFDYVICHGVFSWVTSDLQETILDVCRRVLAPHGIAYVSYNTYPGWHQRRLLRDMVLYHTRNVGDPSEQAARAHDLIRFLGDTARGDDAHSVLLRTARENLEQYVDRPSYMIHEYLEASNEPVYFHDFAARAAAQGLRHLADAEPDVTTIDELPPDIASRLRAMTSDPIELEQYVDFVVNRTFRRSLLVRDDIAAGAPAIERLFASSATKPNDDGGFTTERGRTFSIIHPLANAVLTTLAAAWPGTVAVTALPADPELPDLLMSLHRSGVIDLEAAPRACVNRVSDRPRVSDLARRQAERGRIVTNQRHRAIKLDDPVAHVLVRHLDGTRDRSALHRLLDREAAERRLDLSLDGKAIVDPARVPMILGAVLDHHLRKMVDYALLVE